MAELDLSAEFKLRDDVIYLNHAAVSPWPVRAAEAVKQFAEENMRQGSLHYEQWLARESELRQRLRRLINAASADDIALVKNTSEALSFVAYGIDWQAGDNIVISNQEFPSNRIVWQSLERFGVNIRQVDLGAAATPEDALIAAVDERTRLLAISSVQYASGLRVNLATLGAFCQAEGVLFCVDAIQSLGAIAFDVQAIQADFVMADGHKWMLGPEGLGLFYCRPALRDSLRLSQYGWHMVENHMQFDRKDWSIARSARRFECGSPNSLGVTALNASLSLLEDAGIAVVEQRVCDNAAYLMDKINSHPDLDLITSNESGRYAGIVTFTTRHMSAEEAYTKLKRAGVVCALRGGGIRFSPHFHTSREALDRGIAAVVEG